LGNRFGSPYDIRPLSVGPVCLSVCDVGVLWPNGWMDQDATCYAARPQLTPYSVRLGPSSSSPEGAHPNFWPISVVAKSLDGSRCHLVGKYALAQPTLC